MHDGANAVRCACEPILWVKDYTISTLSLLPIVRLHLFQHIHFTHELLYAELLYAENSFHRTFHRNIRSGICDGFCLQISRKDIEDRSRVSSYR